MRRASLLPIIGLTMLLAAGPVLAANWPMLAHDLRRSGATTDWIELPADRAWVRYFVHEGLSRSVQPVIVGGRLYVGTLAGRMYCLNAATGKDVWVARLGSPIFHTACATEGIVAFGCGDGRIVALDATTGEQRWSYRTGAAIWNAPLIHNGRLYIGGRDGWFYCLDAAAGKLLWRYEAGVHIHQSPALDAERGAVYFTDESMVVHALDAETGRRLWRSEQIWGVTARSFHPVIAPDHTVMVNTIPIYELVPDSPWGRGQRPMRNVVAQALGYAELGKEDLSEVARNHPSVQVPYRALKNPKDWRISAETRKRFEREYREVVLQPEWFDRMQEGFRAEMRKDPATQCLFLLDPQTGRPRAIAPVMYTSFCKSQFTPPMVTPDGKVLTKWVAFLPSTYNAYQPLASMAQIDPATGRMAPLFDELRLGSGNGLRLIGDESCQLSVTGRYLLNLNTGTGEYVNYFDLSDPDRRSLGYVYRGRTHWQGTGVVQRVLRGQARQVGYGQERISQALVASSSSGGGEGIYANMPVAAADGRLFWTNRMYVIALEHTAGASPKTLDSRDLSDFGVEPLSEDELKRLVETWPIDWDSVREGRRGGHLPAGLTPPPGTRQNPDDAAAARADEIPDDVLDRYIWSQPQDREAAHTPLSRSLHRRLSKQVEELISRPMWRAYRFQAGKARPVALHLYADPTDHLYALAVALPYLEPELRERVINYVLTEWRSANPVTTNAEYRADRGEPREFYRLPPQGVEARVQPYPVRPRGRERLHAAWLFARNSGRWDMLEAVADVARKAHSAGRPDTTRPGHNHFNDYVSGLIAACRICRRLGDEQSEQANLRRARQALRERIAHELRFSRGNATTNVYAYDFPGYARWRHLTDEVGRAIRDLAGQPSIDLLRLHLDRRAPFWYLTWGPITPFAGENAMQLPRNCLDGFLAKAYLERLSAEELVVFADVPACRADALHIIKLAITLDAAVRKPE